MTPNKTSTITPEIKPIYKQHLQSRSGGEAMAVTSRSFLQKKRLNKEE